MTDQPAGGSLNPLSLPNPPDTADRQTITKTLTRYHWWDGKQWLENAYTVTIGDREFICRFEAAGRRK